MTRPAPTSMSSPDKLETEDVLALALSLFVPGVGHMMLGQVPKGLAILAATYLSCGMGYLVSVIIVLDAYMVAMARKQRPVDDWEFFPKA